MRNLQKTILFMVVITSVLLAGISYGQEDGGDIYLPLLWGSGDQAQATPTASVPPIEGEPVTTPEPSPTSDKATPAATDPIATEEPAATVDPNGTATIIPTATKAAEEGTPVVDATPIPGEPTPEPTPTDDSATATPEPVDPGDGEPTPDPSACATSADNLVQNPGFESGDEGWRFYTDGKGAMAVVTSAFECDHALQVTLNRAGKNVQLYQHNLALQPDTDYQLEFAAKSSRGQDLAVYLHDHVSGKNYGLADYQVDVTQEWSQFVVRFHTSSAGSMLRNGRLRFWLAPYDQDGDEFWIDAVMLRTVAAVNQPAPLPTYTPLPGDPGPGGGDPLPTATPAPIFPTATPIPVATNTSVPVAPGLPTNTPVPVPPTATYTPVPPPATNTPVPLPPEPTNTSVPLPPVATNTPVPLPPVATNTPVPAAPGRATNTPVPPPPAATNTPVPLPPAATNTPVPLPPAATNTPVPPPAATNTPVPLPPAATNTPVPPPPPAATNTPVPPPAAPTATNTPRPVPPTNTPVPTSCRQYGAGLTRSSRFGVQTFEDTRATSQFFDALVESQAGWVRVITPWGPTEPVNTTPDRYNWTWVDKELAITRHTNIQAIGTIGFAPNWAATNTNGVIDKATLADFTEFVTALVERYDGDGIDDAPCSPVVKYWEFYNEPDRAARQATGYYRNSWGEEPGAYVDMLKAAYPAVKRANPRAKVVFGGIAYEWFVGSGGQFIENFTDQVLKKGGAPYFDIMNFHVYPEFWRQHATQPPGLLEKTVKIRQILQRNGVNKPIFITETGATSNSAASLRMSDEEQARHVPQLFAQAWAADVDVAIWFMLYDSADGTYPYENGLVTASNPPKKRKSFDAYTYAVELFERLNFVRTLPLSERGNASLLAYEFKDRVNGHTLYVAWLNPASTNSTKNLTVAGNRARVRNLYGEESVKTGSNGQITIAVSGQPLYIEITD